MQGVRMHDNFMARHAPGPERKRREDYGETVGSWQTTSFDRCDIAGWGRYPDMEPPGLFPQALY